MKATVVSYKIINLLIA